MKKNTFALREVLQVLIVVGVISAVAVAIYINSNSSKDNLTEEEQNELIELTRTFVAAKFVNLNSILNQDLKSCVQISAKIIKKEDMTFNSNVKSDRMIGYIKINGNYEYEYSKTDPKCDYYINEEGKIMSKKNNKEVTIK